MCTSPFPFIGRTRTFPWSSYLASTSRGFVKCTSAPILYFSASLLQEIGKEKVSNLIMSFHMPIVQPLHTYCLILSIWTVFKLPILILSNFISTATGPVPWPISREVIFNGSNGGSPREGAPEKLQSSSVKSVVFPPIFKGALAASGWF